MAHYMIMHLHDGSYADARILLPESARLMHSRAFSPVTRINGMALVFFEENYNGERIIGHDGDTKGVHSNLALLPDRDVGFFVDFNADGRNTVVYEIRDSILRDFLDRYYPAPIPQEPTLAAAVDHVRLVAGTYQPSRRLNGMLSVFMMFNSITVAANPDGTFSLSMPPSGERQTYHEIAPFVWREVGGKGLMQARMKDGQVASLHFDPIDVLIKVPAWKGAGLNVPLLVVAILAILLGVLLWPIGSLLRRHYRRPFSVTGATVRAFRLSRLGMLAMLLFILGWLFLAANLLSHFYLFNAGLDPWIRLLQIVGLLGVAGAVATAWYARCAWQAGLAWRTRIWNLLLAAMMTWLVWFTFAFNLITASLDY
jgi:hypothetical protein